jgi:hypothetical protein
MVTKLAGIKKCFPLSSWPGLTRPSIALASASTKEFSRRVDTHRMDGRLEGGHDEWSY